MTFKQVGLRKQTYERLTDVLLDIAKKRKKKQSYSDIIDFLINIYIKMAVEGA